MKASLTKTWWLFVLAAACGLFDVGGRAGELPPGSPAVATAIHSFLEGHCLDCHSGDEPSGDTPLETLTTPMTTTADLERWERVLAVITSGEMPPEDVEQPAADRRRAVVDWIEHELLQAAETLPAPQPPLARRLTNFEYGNTLRDLIGFELDVLENLPEDPIERYAFNNNAEVMLLGPELMDRYRENARRIMASCIVDSVKPEIHRTEKQFEPRVTPELGMLADEVGVFGNSRHTAAGGVGIKSWPKTGEYRIRIEAAAILPEGFDEVPLMLMMGQGLDVNSSAQQVEPAGTAFIDTGVDEPRVYEFRGRIENHPTDPARVVRAGRVIPEQMTITPINITDNGQLNDHRHSGFDGSWALAMPRAVIRSIEFEAPVTDTWPPEHHRRVLFDSPHAVDDPAYARAVIERFAARAFRRPPTDEELTLLMRIHAIHSDKAASPEEAFRNTLSTVLVSPQFLYHTVTADGVTPPQYALASRLSYFLWGSMPDEELMSLAAKRCLDDPAAIASQVRRILADPKSEDFVRNFTLQWLDIAKAKAVKINTELFPRFLYLVHIGERAGTEVPYRPTIRDYMEQETVGFIAELIRRNASVLEIVDSEFAMLNEPLAAHYNVEGVRGIRLRPVPIRPEHRLGGLLTQGSVLVANSTGSAPHPVYRAVWLREAILGEEVRPPPAQVPALTDTAGEAATDAVSIKEALRLHREDQQCGVCHAQLDPWGIPFERYSATGRYQPFVPPEGTRVRGFRDSEDRDLAGYQAYLENISTVEIEADARLPLGPQVDGIDELKAFLLEHRQEDIAENLIRRLLAYAIGRRLTVHDRPAVNQILAEVRDRDYRWQDIIIAICQSEAFRRADTPPSQKETRS